MGDWIDDVFDELDGRAVSETVRSRLWSLLDSAQPINRKYLDPVATQVYND